jgi:hypothetical protein
MSRQFSSPRLKTHWSRTFFVSGQAQHGLRGLPSLPMGTVEAGAEGVETASEAIVSAMCVKGRG